MRSQLLVVLLLLVPVRGESQEARPGGAWQLTTPRAELPNQASITLALDALNVVRGPIVTFRPALYLRCLDRKLEAFVATGAVRDRDADYRTTVRLQWAVRAPVEETWRRSTEYSAVFPADPAAFIQQLLATPALVFEFHPAGAAPIVAQFNGEGLDSYIPRLESRCPGFMDPRSPVGVRSDQSDQVYGETEVNEQAEPLSVPAAEYPPLLRRAGIQGKVIVQGVVDTLGRVEHGSVRVVTSTNPAFNEAALSAIRRAVFRPARLDGHPVRAMTRLPVEFK